MADEAYLRKLREHPERYLKLVGFDRDEPTYGEWMREMVYGTSDYTLQAFRGSGKTTCVSGALALKVILFPNKKVAFFRKTDHDTMEVMVQVQKMLLAPATLVIVKRVWGVPLKLTKASYGEISTNLTSDPRGAAQLSGMGINGSITGKHYDEIFTDDIVNLKDRQSRAERDRTKTAYMELRNILNRGGRIMNTGTPWHVDDAFSIMAEAHRWDYTTMPNVMTPEDAAEVRKKMTASLWAANYELRHIPSDDVIFTSPKTGGALEMVYHGECHVDAAYYGEDFTALSVMAVHDGIRYVYGRIWRKHVEDVTPEIVAEYRRLMLGRLYTETNADKGYSAQAFKREGMRVVPYPETMNKHVKIVTYLKAAWGDIVFVDGTDPEYIDQICDYTEDAEHDDAPDSLASLCQRGRFRAKKPDGPTLY